MSKKGYFHFRISEKEKEIWQQYADENFDGALAKLVRAAVGDFISGKKELEDQDVMEILNRILTIIEKRKSQHS